VKLKWSSTAATLPGKSDDVPHLKYLFKPHWCIGGEIFIQLRRIDPDCPSPSLPVSVTLHPDWAMKIGKVCPFLYWTKFPQDAATFDPGEGAAHLISKSLNLL
jgi:hypothetical protein